MTEKWEHPGGEFEVFVEEYVEGAPKFYELAVPGQPQRLTLSETELKWLCDMYEAVKAAPSLVVK